MTTFQKDTLLYCLNSKGELIISDLTGNETARIELDYNHSLGRLSSVEEYHMEDWNDTISCISFRDCAFVFDRTSCELAYSIGYDQFGLEFWCYDSKKDRVICSTDGKLIIYPRYTPDQLYEKAMNILYKTE